MTDNCAYCGDCWDQPQSYAVRVYKWQKHLDDCYMRKLWLRSHSWVEAYKEHLTETENE